MVDTFRICGLATRPAASASTLNFSRISLLLVISASVVRAPISTPSPVSRIYLSSAMPAMSITTLGRLMRSLNQSRLSLPPAIFQMSLPRRSRSERASASLVGCSSSKLGIMSRIMAAFLSLRVGGKRLVGLRALGDGVHDHVGHYRRAIEVMPAHGVGDGAEERRTGAALQRLADPAGPEGGAGIRHIDGVPLHFGGHVEIAHRLLAEEGGIGRKSDLRIEHVAFGRGHPEPHHRTALDLG